jgi:hypothetical protein
LQSKRRANGRKYVSNTDKHFLSLPQNAKIGFKALTVAQSHLTQIQNFKTQDHQFGSSSKTLTMLG